ncbi:glutaminyl-peptide cyclotransferase family protein [Aspergillus mulundensis]|uniref:Peptide hydrolase n=1 Tax=Aspergillus mulundensis TaxID=1810919 RepID=A0A3D8R595_9EURO|nr:hypothetical protein DSM5745_08861 [Aspergillus mulundensis]RDW69101.1 hypothetical protein DSM5745_08861 [Aspergillus mulundensis]
MPALTLIAAVCFLLSDTHAYTPLSTNTLSSLPRPEFAFNIHTGAILAPLLHPRIPGTPGSRAARQHITSFFATNLPTWTIEYQTSTSKIPVTESPRTTFANIIVSRDPPGLETHNVSRLTLAAHYDSLSTPDLEGFIGAIDSAAPCAILMHLAQSIDPALTRKWASTPGRTNPTDQEPVGIQLLFLDGEETFATTLLANDGLYGSRALAAQWAVTAYPDTAAYESRLDAIALFVLLDLLGSRDPTIPSFYPVTHADYQRLADLERRLRELDLLESGTGGDPHHWFVDADLAAMDVSRAVVQDDQVPFAALGVRVLHVIDVEPETGGFPAVWHTMDDDGAHLDLATVGDWGVLVTAFVAEWLGLEEFI